MQRTGMSVKIDKANDELARQKAEYIANKYPKHSIPPTSNLVFDYWQAGGDIKMDFSLTGKYVGVDQHRMMIAERISAMVVVRDNQAKADAKRVERDAAMPAREWASEAAFIAGLYERNAHNAFTRADGSVPYEFRHVHDMGANKIAWRDGDGVWHMKPISRNALNKLYIKVVR